MDSTDYAKMMNLATRLAILERKVDYLLTHLGIDYVDVPTTESDLSEVVSLLQAGKKIQAIALLRELRNMGLAEAKNAVDMLEAKLGLRL